DYAKRYPGFDLRLCLSRENSMIEPYEYKGYVTNQLESLAPNPDEDHYLLCGNPRMIDDVWARLKALGLRHRQVVREKYEFAKTTAAPKQALTDEQKQLIADKLAKHQKKGAS
ncbi:MAG: hypothetical protein ACR2PJ_07390, partial [Pseudomonadales bacterium]